MEIFLNKSFMNLKASYSKYNPSNMSKINQRNRGKIQLRLQQHQSPLLWAKVVVTLSILQMVACFLGFIQT